MFTGRPDGGALWQTQLLSVGYHRLGIVPDTPRLSGGMNSRFLSACGTVAVWVVTQGLLPMPESSLPGSVPDFEFLEQPGVLIRPGILPLLFQSLLHRFQGLGWFILSFSEGRQIRQVLQ